MDLAFPVAGALLVPWTRSSTGRRTFAVYGPRTRNRPAMVLRKRRPKLTPVTVISMVRRPPTTNVPTRLNSTH